MKRIRGEEGVQSIESEGKLEIGLHEHFVPENTPPVKTMVEHEVKQSKPFENEIVGKEPKIEI